MLILSVRRVIVQFFKMEYLKGPDICRFIQLVRVVEKKCLWGDLKFTVYMNFRV